MLDTNICIYAIKQRPPEVLAALRAQEVAGLGLSSVTVAELAFGVAKSGSARNQRALEQHLGQAFEAECLGQAHRLAASVEKEFCQGHGCCPEA